MSRRKIFTGAYIISKRLTFESKPIFSQRMNPSDFIAKVLCAALWEDKARHLLMSAKVLRSALEPSIKAKGCPEGDDWHQLATYYLLVHFALENLLKAIEVKSKPVELAAEMKERCKLPETLRTSDHDISDLAKKYNVIEQEVGHEAMLKKLQHCAVWYGRYPVGVSVAKTENFYQSEFVDFPVSLTSWCTTDFQDLDTIIERAIIRLKTA